MLISAYKSFWLQGVNFQGRTRLGEFWWALLAQCLLISVASILLVGLGMTLYPIGSTQETHPAGFAVVLTMVAILAIYTWPALSRS